MITIREYLEGKVDLENELFGVPGVRRAKLIDIAAAQETNDEETDEDER